jgi:hypothetical protein
VIHPYINTLLHSQTQHPDVILDVIGNAGGDIILGYQLAQLMYPNATWEDYANPYDVLWSPTVDLYVNKVEPLIADIVDSVDDFQNITDRFNNNPGMYRKIS